MTVRRNTNDLFFNYGSLRGNTLHRFGLPQIRTAIDTKILKKLFVLLNMFKYIEENKLERLLGYFE